MTNRSRAALLASALITAGAAQLPTRETCADAIQAARAAANRLPAGSVARKFADFDLFQARAEAGNGEFDDCLEYAAKALDEALHPHHAVALTPGHQRN